MELRRIVVMIGVALVVLAAVALTVNVASGKELKLAADSKMWQAADAPPSPARGCTACHVPGGIDAEGKYSLFWEAKERAAAEGTGGQHPMSTPDGKAMTYQTNVDTCLTCHKPGTGARAGRGAGAPYALRDIVHPAHLFSVPFKEEFSGNCFSCHNVAGDGTWELLSQKVEVNEKGVPKTVPIPGALRPSQTLSQP